MKVPPLTVGQMELMMDICAHGSGFQQRIAAGFLPNRDDVEVLEKRGLIKDWKITQAGSRLIDQMKALTTVPC